MNIFTIYLYQVLIDVLIPESISEIPDRYGNQFSYSSDGLRCVHMCMSDLETTKNKKYNPNLGIK